MKLDKKEIKVGHLVRVKENLTTAGKYEDIKKWLNWRDAVGKVLVVTTVGIDSDADDGHYYILQSNKYGINFYRPHLEAL